MLKCNKANICNNKRCPHYKKHKEIFNGLETSLCGEEECLTLKTTVKCGENA